MLKRIIKKFIKIEYIDNKVAVFVHIKLPFKEKRYIHFRLPVSFDRKKIYGLLYAKNPIQSNKVVFDNYMGKPFGCNSKYVVKKLLEKYPNKLDIVWVVSKKEMVSADFPEGVRLVEYASADARKEYASAKVWVSNYHKISYVKKGMYRKPGQYFIQMWHGSLGIKKIENDVPVLTENESWLLLAKESSEMTTHWISNSAFETEVYKQAFWGVDNVLEFGHPRNDILINGDASTVEKVRRTLNIGNRKILFYAPTFREDYRLECYQIDYERLKAALEQKFGGEWVFIVRLHPRVRNFSEQLLPDTDYIIDGTYYPDIQELILCADSMITDYSSCIFDFLLTRRPGFIFATDIAEYNTERGFYYPLESTPFLIAANNDELLANIRDFDMDHYREKSEAFLRSKGCVDDGKASERVADLIMELTKQ